MKIYLEKPERLFVFLSFAITWSVVLLAFRLYRLDYITVEQLNITNCFGALGPIAAALLTAFLFYGKSGVNKLLTSVRLSGWDHRTSFLVFSPILLVAIGLLCYPLLSGSPYTPYDTQKQFNLIDTIHTLGWILPFISYGILEEFGWRGFLLPHLQQRFTAFQSSLLIAVIWAVWHWPFFLWRFQFSVGMAFGFFFSLMIGSILLTTIYNITKGNLLATVIFHLLNNLASSLDKEYLVIFLSVGLTVLTVFVLIKFGKSDLCPEGRVKNFFQPHSSNGRQSPFKGSVTSW